jgi:hypothetical protein
MDRHGGAHRSRRPPALVGIAVVTIAVVVIALVGVGCSSDATTTELADDPADVTVPGPRPTAPTEDDDSGLSASGNELLAQLEAVSEETDLCKVLTGEAFATLLSEDVDVASLVTSPSGVTQLLTLVDATFAQLVVIAPPAVRPAMTTIQEVWTRVASLNTGAADAQERTAEILAEPQVQQANQTLITWAALNCPGAAANLAQG